MSNKNSLSALLLSKRVFINHIDQYQGRNVGKHLSVSVVGSSLEEQEGDDESASQVSETELKPKENCFEVVGTVKNANTEKPDFAKEIIKYEDRNELYTRLNECDIIIYDITDDYDQIDEAVWAATTFHENIEKIEKPKTFICISTVLTWAKSKALDMEESDIPFTEDDYRRRKCHPNFKDYLEAEKTITKYGKTKKSMFVTYVVCSALTYGAGENIFHFLFKDAWHNAPSLQCYGSGDNIVPTIHIKDLSMIIQNLIDSRPKVRYILAKDESNNTLLDIVTAVSSKLGTGKVEMINKEDALLNNNISQADFDMLLINLRMDSMYVKENMSIQWVAETGIVENITSIINDYKKSRKLLPFRVCILGPPDVGKTTMTEGLCKHFKLHHLHIKNVIQTGMERLEKTSRREDVDEEEEDDGQAQIAQETLENIAESKDPNTGYLEDQYIIKFFRDAILSKPCQNQGFIIDGYPKTVDQARELFANESGEDDDKNFDPAIMPEFLFFLDANEEFLRDRVMNLPEKIVNGTHNTEDAFLQRYSTYRQLNTEDITVLNYFDELEIHPIRFDISKDTSEMMTDTLAKLTKAMGDLRNYGPTEEELAEIKMREEEEKVKQETEEKERLDRLELEELAERERRQKEWADRLDEVKREEYELLEAKAAPLRNYVMKHVMPTLTKGLIDCTKVRPEDPIDYLAEYLFKNNPQVD